MKSAGPANGDRSVSGTCKRKDKIMEEKIMKEKSWKIKLQMTKSLISA